MSTVKGEQAAVTASRALASDVNGFPVAAATTAAELDFVSGVTSGIQAQINAISPSGNPATTEPGTPTTLPNGEDYFLLPSYFLGSSVVAGQTGFTANELKCLRFSVPKRLTVAKLVFEVTTLSVGKFAYIGVYSSDGATLLVDSGQISTTTTGIKTVTLGASVLLVRGQYIFAFGTDSALPGFRVLGPIAGVLNILNGNTVHYGTAANAISGALPSTLGALSSNVLLGLPVTVLQG